MWIRKAGRTEGTRHRVRIADDHCRQTRHVEVPDRDRRDVVGADGSTRSTNVSK
jgi:hypothetical protein